MQTRDVFAACIGFTAACALQVTPHYLERPGVLLAVLQVMCWSAFLASIAGYVAAATRPESKPASRNARRPPETEFQLLVTGQSTTVAQAAIDAARAQARTLNGRSPLGTTEVRAVNGARAAKHSRRSQVASTPRSTPVQ